MNKSLLGSLAERFITQKENLASEALNQFNRLKTNYLKITAASRYIFSLVSFKKDAADKNPCLNETGGDKNKKKRSFLTSFTQRSPY